MNDDPSAHLDRRTVLKSVAATGFSGTVISDVGAAAEETTRVIETGIRYDVEVADEFSVVQIDSRPRFTVDDTRSELVIGNDVSVDRVNNIRQAGGLVNEAPAAVGNSISARDSGREIDVLTTDISTRMRPKRGLVLAEPTTYPRVKVQRRSATPRLIISGTGTFELGVGTDREVTLDTTTVKAQTVEKTGEVIEWEDLPEHMWNAERTYGSETVNATPVVRVVDHGRVPVRQADML